MSNGTEKTASGAFNLAADQEIPQSAVIVHADHKWHEKIAQGQVGFFEKAARALHACGHETYLVPSFSRLSNQLVGGPQKHILIGQERLIGANLFHAQPAYITGFWYLDPKGYFWNSSMMGRAFSPEGIDPKAARYFFDGVAGWRMRNNVSGRKQARPIELESADAAVFTQDIERYSNPVHYLTTQQMIRTTANSVSGLCYVKPHPLLTARQREKLERLCGRLPNTRVTDASVHDIIRASKVIVSQNSAVGFEALMYKKPVLTCAQTDYAAATLTCRSPQELRANIQRSANWFVDFPYEVYFYWFLHLNMLEPQNSAFADRVVARLYGEEKPSWTR